TAGLRPALPTAGGLPLVVGSSSKRSICSKPVHPLSPPLGRGDSSPTPLDRERRLQRLPLPFAAEANAGLPRRQARRRLLLGVCLRWSAARSAKRTARGLSRYRPIFFRTSASSFSPLAPSAPRPRSTR